MSNTVQAAAEGLPTKTRDIGDAIDVLCRAMSINQLVSMAGANISMRDEREAITTGADVVDNMLDDVKSILYAKMDREGGAA